MVACKILYLWVAFFVIGISIALQLFPLSKERKLSWGFSTNSVLNFTEAARRNQYISEEHTVVTEDGYVLSIFRIPRAGKCRQMKKQRPVLLMHGLLQNSDIFLDAGPSAGLAYLLSDACFDVWVGNQRGNNYGRKHLRWNPDKNPKFWHFSVDEIGFYDVPATIDYILKESSADKVNYVGFSQGCGIFFAMCSERPDYCKKTGVMVALAPAVFLVNQESKLLKFMFRSAVMFEKILNALGIREVFSKGEFLQVLLEYMCQKSESSWAEKLCSSAGFLDGYNSGSMSVDTWRLMFSHFFVGTSFNSFVRYGQAVESGKFQKFDYGAKVNLERYNTTSVPEYNLTSVTTPVVLIQGRSDKLVDVKDTYYLSTKLPKVLEVALVSDPNWTHFDMVYSQKIKSLVYPKVYDYLQKYS